MRRTTVVFSCITISLYIASHTVCCDGYENARENYTTVVNTITRWRNELEDACQDDPLERIPQNVCNTCYNSVYPAYDSALYKLQGINYLGPRNRDRILNHVGYYALACFAQCPHLMHGRYLYDVYYHSQCVGTRRKMSAQQERKELLYCIGSLRWALRDYVRELHAYSDSSKDVDAKTANTYKEVYENGLQLSQKADKKLAQYAPQVDLKHVPLQVRAMERELEKNRYKCPTNPDTKNVATIAQLAQTVEPVNKHAKQNGYVLPIERAPGVLEKVKAWYAH